MPSSARNCVEGLTSRLKLAGVKANRLQAFRDRLVSDLSSVRSELESLSETSVNLSKVEELLKALMDSLVVKQVQSIESVITEGLQTIFHDQDLYFEAEVGPKYNKISIDFFIRQGGSDSSLAIRGKPLDSFGGGPSSVASLLLRVITLTKLKKAPLLLLDETLLAVSDEYIESTARFLKVLSSRMGIPILLITHKSAYLDHADTPYRGYEVVEPSGERHLSLKRL